jgi:hypothetical protein
MKRSAAIFKDVTVVFGKSHKVGAETWMIEVFGETILIIQFSTSYP